MSISPFVIGGIVLGVLVVGYTLGRAMSGGNAGTHAPLSVQGQTRSRMPEVPEDVLAEVRALLAANPSGKILAIKLVRERTWLGLKESKDLVDSLSR